MKPVLRLRDMPQDRKLVEDYRAAWTEFDRALRRFQSEAADRDHEHLLLAVETARARYSAARDRLVSRMLEADSSHLAPVSDESRIRGSARLFWEVARKPGNSAESDWLRAEALVRGAS